jgi:hypothetical protein
MNNVPALLNDFILSLSTRSATGYPPAAWANWRCRFVSIREGLRHIAVPVDAVAASPDLKAATKRRKPVDRMPCRYRRIIIVVIDLMRRKNVTPCTQEIETVSGHCSVL